MFFLGLVRIRIRMRGVADLNSGQTSFPLQASCYGRWRRVVAWTDIMAVFCTGDRLEMIDRPG